MRNAYRFASLVLALCLLCACAAAEPELPARDEAGYLAGEGEYVYENDDEGRYVYLTQNIQIDIQRFIDDSIPLEWYETHIYLRNGEALRVAEVDAERPGTRFQEPYTIAQNNQFVLGFTDDFYGHRIYRDDRVGVVIRGGELISEKTYRKAVDHLPNLDVLAQLPDGSLKAYRCLDVTADELMEMGAVNVFCFGPALIMEGEINEAVSSGTFENKAPRQALGMIEPGHYFLLTAQGRKKDSEGVGMIYMAERMQAVGVVEALNLDGGNTMALIFRGRMINRLGSTNIRSVSSLIGVGVSEYSVED